MKCIICGKEIDENNKEVHHISYPVKEFPEVTVPVHKKCHNIIHHTDFYEELQPRKGHSCIYYNNGVKKDEKEREKENNMKPIKKFINDRIIIEQDNVIERRFLFEEFKKYCKNNNLLIQPSDYSIFVRKFNKLVENARKYKPTRNGKQILCFKHVKINKKPEKHIFNKINKKDNNQYSYFQKGTIVDIIYDNWKENNKTPVNLWPEKIQKEIIEVPENQTSDNIERVGNIFKPCIIGNILKNMGINTKRKYVIDNSGERKQKHCIVWDENIKKVFNRYIDEYNDEKLNSKEELLKNIFEK